MKPESFRLRGWVIAGVGFLFLIFSLLVSLIGSQRGGSFIAYAVELWTMSFLILMGITGAVLILVGLMFVLAGHMAEYLKR